MGNDQETRMGATFEAWTAPEDAERPARGTAPFMVAPSAELTDWGVMMPGRVRYANGPAFPIGQRPAEVTPEMTASAMSALAETYLVCTLGSAEDAVVSIIRAALAYQPVELVSPAESALIRERDHWKTLCEDNATLRLQAVECMKLAAKERDEARAELATLQGEAKLIAEELLRYADEDRTLRAELAAGDNELSRELSAANGRIAAMSAELMAAHDKLARQAKALGDAANTIAALTHTESTPGPIANAIRDHDTDRRMVGR